MKSIGFITASKNNLLIPDISRLSEAEQRDVVLLINAAPNTFNMADECPLRVVEAFINDE